MEEEVGRPWVVPVGIVVIALVVVATAGGAVGLGTSGPAGTATAAVVVYAACGIAYLLRRPASPAATVALLLVMGAAAAVLHHADPTGPVVGLFLVTAFAPLHLESRPAAAVALVALLLFDVVLVLDQPRPLVSAAVVSGGAAFFFVFGLLLRREGEQRRRADALLLEREAGLQAEMAAAALAERHRVARDLHDVLAHTLSGLVVHLDGARLLAQRDGTDPALREVVTTSHQLARDGLAEARQAVSALRGTTAPGPELIPALVEEHRRLTGSSCTVTVTGTPRPVDADVRTGLYRVAQEALSNVRKHAPGARTRVTLDWRADDVVLEVVDHGGGASLAPAGPGAGLTGMAERAALAGGELEAGPRDGGFRVLLRMPLRDRRTP